MKQHTAPSRRPVLVRSARAGLARALVRRSGPLALTVALLMAFAGEVRAEQFVLFDATFTYTWDMAINAKPSKSHFYVNEGNFLNKMRPANWMSPVNYRNGTVHIRAEVIEKPPGTQQAGWALCYVANVGGYGCPYTDYYKSTGVYERDIAMTAFYNNTTLQWDRGVKQVDLVYTINGSGSGHVSNFPALKDAVTPTKVRITMIQVSQGSTYDPSILGMIPATPEPARDGGVADAASSDTPAAVDTGTTTDPEPPVTGSGGAGGSATGSGGSSGAGTGGTVTTPPPGGGAGGSGPPAIRDPVSGGCALATRQGGSSGPSGAEGVSAVLGLIALVVIGRARRRRR